MKKQKIINFGLKLGIKQNDILKVLEKITGLDKNQLFLSKEIDDKYIEKIEKYFSRLVAGEPIEYILQKAEFYGYDFYVDSRVLVPRNDTEVMVDKVVESIKTLSLAPLLIGEGNKKLILIDVGTGSGCIPIAILNELKKKNFILPKTFAIDISKDALEVAKINIKKHNLEDKIELIQGNLLKSLSSKLSTLSSIIITANLPYIKNRDFENMDEQTIIFEPDLALYGGEKTGFELYEKLIYEIFELQSISNIKNITLFIEVGFDQKQITIDFLKKQNLKFEFFKDNNGIVRIVKIYFNLKK